ncbi:hypothetical protein SAMN03097699_2763 [Flavobacteriaceae bacterium MAR_2010_188]|nr:hypothetical protein SAMN03097699_2763 [Flavobacteriaceae bacterium MAR_2010_188]
MNDIIQYILIFIALAFALTFLVRKFIWKPASTKSSKSCGTDDCGCH